MSTRNHKQIMQDPNQNPPTTPTPVSVVPDPNPTVDNSPVPVHTAPNPNPTVNSTPKPTSTAPNPELATEKSFTTAPESVQYTEPSKDTNTNQTKPDTSAPKDKQKVSIVKNIIAVFKKIYSLNSLAWSLFIICLVGLVILNTTLQNSKSSLSKELSDTKDSLTKTQTLLAVAQNDTTSAKKDLKDYQKKHPEMSDEELIKKTILSWNNSQLSNSKDPDVKISKIQLPFALVKVGDSDSNDFICLLKKVDDIWLIASCEQGSPDSFTRSNWMVPKTF